MSVISHRYCRDTQSEIGTIPYTALPFAPLIPLAVLAHSCRSQGVWRSKTSAFALEFTLRKCTFPSSRLISIPWEGGEGRAVGVQIRFYVGMQGSRDGMGSSGGNSHVDPSKREAGKNRKEKKKVLASQLSLETVAWRRNLIWEPENNVGV